MGVEILKNGANYFQEIPLNNDPNRLSIYKFGRNPNVGATEVIIGGGGIYGLPETAETVVCASDEIEDNPTGSGARSIHVFGLDANYKLIDEIVNIGESTEKEYLRIFRAHVETAGTTTPIDGANIGNITITQDNTAVDMAYISQGDGQTLVACFTVPAGFTALMWSADTTTGEGKNSTNRVKSKEFGSDFPFRVKGIRDNFQNTVGIQYKIPNKYEEKTDIVFTAKSSAAGTPVSATFTLELIKND